MVSVEDAFSILKNNLPVSKEVEYALLQARNHVLSQTVYSPINMPPFRQSAMDGFALCMHADLYYEIVGEIKAGDSLQVVLLPGQAIKIFTGAPVPDSAQAVIQIEKVSAKDGILYLEEPAKVAMNIRPIGEQNGKGDLALEKGTLLNSACIGFLAGLGFTSVKVYQKPAVGILVTGNELVQPGNPLEYGKIYESNSIMLQTALYDAGFHAVTLYEVDDDFENTKNKLHEALTSNDMVLVSGGISVGDYDFVEQALQALAVETLFYKVKQKPGKPLYAGRLGDKMVFALPGNPAASLTCFYVYVLPTLQMISGRNLNYGQTVAKKLAHDFSVSNARNQFLKAHVTGDEVTILSHQNSSMLNSFSVANGLVYVEEGGYELPKGTAVGVYLLGK
jgi:molybdopterin molybdotransferase